MVPACMVNRSLLVEMGLTPVEALRAATSVPATAFGLQDRGRIASGLRADLLLVEGNPDSDILSTRNIVGVWKQGRALDRGAYRRDLPRMGAPKPSIGLQRGPVSNFDTSVRTEFGSEWQVFDGVRLSRIETGANGTPGALAMRGEVEVDRPPRLWPGIVFFPGGLPDAAVELGSRRELRFYARGDGQTYRVVVEATAGSQVDSFIAGEKWEEQRILFRAIDGSLTYGLQSIIFAGPSTPGRFELQIDEIRFQ